MTIEKMAMDFYEIFIDYMEGCEQITINLLKDIKYGFVKILGLDKNKEKQYESKINYYVEMIYENIITKFIKYEFKIEKNGELITITR